MATWYSQEMTGSAALPVVKPAFAQYGSAEVMYQASILLTAQAIADTIVIGSVQAGAAFLGGLLNTDTSLSTSTIAIGNAATPGKYKTAGVFTATNTPTPFGNVAAMANVQLASSETQIITIAALALPASGNLIVQMNWALAGV